MFLIDDVLFSPVTGLLHIFRELHQVVQQDAVNEAAAIRAELSELYMLLETSQITEAEADAQEKELLDRLEEIETRGSNSDEDEDDDEEPEDEEPTDESDASALAEGEEPSAEDGP
jgi:hypothetical protein